MLGQLLAFHDGDAAPAQGVDARRLHLVDGQARIAAAALAHHIGDLVGPRLQLLLQPAAGGEIVPAGGAAHLVDGLDIAGQMFRPAIFEVDGMTVGAHDCVMRGIVRHPLLHVGHIQRIADIDRVIEKDCRAIVSGQLIDDAPLAVGTSPLQGVERNRALERPVGAFAIEIFLLARILEDVGHGRGALC
jgi:hypothetical protein